jgi:glycosyltransferase involved in cell wall biosynthesis
MNVAIEASASGARPLKYAYVKNGNAVDQVRRLLSRHELDRSGPDAFIGDFLAAHAGDELLVLCRTKERDRFERGNVRAMAFAVGTAPLWSFFSRVWTALRVSLAVVRWRPDRILCGCTGELLWACAAAAKILRVPLVHSRHNEVRERAGAGRIVTVLDRASIRACSGVVCHGPFLRDQIRALGVPSTRTHEFEVDLNQFAAAGRQSRAPVELQDFASRFHVVFMFVGRIQIDKGVIDLLDAVAGMRSTADRRVGLIYLGEGKDSVLLNRRLQQLKMSDRVLLPGKIAHSQLPGAMRLSSAIITPTRPEFPEGRCMVVLESLVLGIPVIGPASGPFPYAVQENVNGMLFVPGDVDSLRAVLERIVREPSVLDRLARGAEQSAPRLLAPPCGFARAVEAAFAG